jgi:penicillin-binding protein 1A
MLAAVLVGGVYLYIAPQIPPIESLKDVQLQVPLRVYTRERKLIAEFGEKRRSPVSYDEIPKPLIQAFLAAEDDRFFEHPGVDYQGIIRAAIELVRTGEKRQGGSTITMQVARNFFLTTEKTYLRKLTEIVLALKIERMLEKEDILELYLNKIYLGHRAYGVEAAAQVYYGAGIRDLSVAQMAMIAVLPKAPSRVNPVDDPSAALARRNYILGRMHSLHYIDDESYKEATSEVDMARIHTVSSEAQAPYLAEMVRAEMVTRFGADAYTSGYQVITTVEEQRQAAANQAVRSALMEYDHRHGYRGPEGNISSGNLGDKQARDRSLQGFPPVAGLMAGVVIAAGPESAQVYLRDGTAIDLDVEGISWARPFVSVNRRGKKPRSVNEVVHEGDVVRVSQQADGSWELAQVPDVEGALVSVRADDGGIVALVGGIDFKRSKFNRVTQARRQPGSSFKPFVYSAALEKGFTVASLINDAPVVFEDPSLEATWRPENYSGRFYGPTRLREALVNSRNLVSVRLLKAIGTDYAAEYAERFGFGSEQLPRNLSLALGSGSVSPLQMARAYAVLANGGYLVEPYYIQMVLDVDGGVLGQAEPTVACPDCDLDLEGIMPGTGQPVIRVADAVITPENAWFMNSMLRDVIQRGTGRKARELGRSDIAGKTGTTNDQRDAWFCGFNRYLVAVAWVGYDKLDPLGNAETGGRAALPMWIAYMKEALSDLPQDVRKQPPGLVTVRIDPQTGKLARSGEDDGIFETFPADRVPEPAAASAAIDTQRGTGEAGGEHLF